MDDKSVLIKLPNRCLFESVNGVWEQYLEGVPAGSTFVFDAGEVTHIDVAGLQVVLAMVRDLARQEKKVEWQARSDEFRACAALGGLGKQLLADGM